MFEILLIERPAALLDACTHAHTQTSNACMFAHSGQIHFLASIYICILDLPYIEVGEGRYEYTPRARPIMLHSMTGFQFTTLLHELKTSAHTSVTYRQKRTHCKTIKEANIRPKPFGISLLARNIIINQQQYAKQSDKITFWPPGRKQDSSLLGCYEVSKGNWLLRFRKIVNISSSQSFLIHRNVCN